MLYMFRLNKNFFSSLNNQLYTVLSCNIKRSINRAIKLYEEKLASLKRFAHNLGVSSNNKEGNVTPIHKSVDKFSRFDLPYRKVLKPALTFLLLLAFIGMLSLAYRADEKSVVITYVDIKVNDGDTLWSIAAQHVSNKEDVRDLIYHIRNINGLNQNAQIYVGQTLKIPVL